MEKENIEKKNTKVKKNKHVEELELKLKTFEEETLRAKADLINYRKRKDEEVSNLLKYSNADILLSLLSFICRNLSMMFCFILYIIIKFKIENI